MLYFAIGGVAFGVLGTAYGITCYYKLWQWARQCQQARIVVAFKGRVTLNAPLLEWLLWCNMLDKDDSTNGRVVYRNASTSVAIIKKSFGAKTPIHEFVAWVRRRAKFDKVWGYQPEGSGGPQLRKGPQVQEGKWTSKDETVKP